MRTALLLCALKISGWIFILWMRFDATIIAAATTSEGQDEINTNLPTGDRSQKIFSSLNLPSRFHGTTFILGIFNSSCSRYLLRPRSELKYAAVTFLESSART